jgi:hypothetical protein
VSKLNGGESREHPTRTKITSKLSEDKGKKMRFWFGRKSAPDARPFVPAWLNTEQQPGFARSYDAQFEEVYRRNPVGQRAVRLVSRMLGRSPE